MLKRAIHNRIKAKRAQFLRKSKDPKNFGPAKMLASSMLEAGINPNDPEQVDNFTKNQLPDELARECLQIR